MVLDVILRWRCTIVEQISRVLKIGVLHPYGGKWYRRGGDGVRLDDNVNACCTEFVGNELGVHWVLSDKNTSHGRLWDAV